MGDDFTKRDCLKKLAEIRYAAAGFPGILLQIDGLDSSIAKHDFDAHSERSKTIREGLLSTDLFPGASRKKLIRVELSPGQFVEGKFQDYRPACVSFWTRDGIIEVPFHLLEKDLQRCFPNDPTVQGEKILTQAISDMNDLLAQLSAAYADAEAQLNNHREMAESLNQRLKELADENSALTSENSALKATLEKVK